MLFAALALLLAADPGIDPERAELDRVASRIERLKTRQLAGEDVAQELENLLVRAQELAQRIERERRREGVPPATAPGPSPEELKERADALRDESDRIGTQLRDLDGRIEVVRRERRVEAGLESLAQESALFGDPGASRVSPKAPPTPGGPGLPEPGELLSPRASGAEEKPQGTALQRLDRLRAQRAKLVERKAALEAEAVTMDAEASQLSRKR